MRPRAVKRRNSLHLTVPDDLDMEGLLVPGAMSDTDAEVPLDFTSISSREVGRQHSHWSVRHSYLLYLLGNLRAEVGNLRYDLRNVESAWMSANEGRFKAKWEAEYHMGRAPGVKKLRRRLRQAENRLTRFEGLSEAYKALREASSREMSRRSTETASRD